MRPIKFRAWDGERWYYFSLADLANGATQTTEFCDVELTKWGEFTGLIDKNVKEIYEGDIVRIGSFVPQVWQVGFDRGGFCFFNEGDSFYNDIKYCEDGEVIGNIYDNPDLI